MITDQHIKKSMEPPQRHLPEIVDSHMNFRYAQLLLLTLRSLLSQISLFMYVCMHKHKAELENRNLLTKR